MPIQTTNYGLNKPDRGQSDWDSLINGDLDSIDTLLHGKQDTSTKGEPNGYAGLDGSGKVPTSQLPPLASTLAADTDVAIATPANGDVLTYDSASGKWKNLPDNSPAQAVTSVAGKTGAVTLAESDVTGLVSDLAAKEATANKGQVNGYASLDGSGKVPSAQIPAIAESGVTGLVSDLAAKEATANKGVANGYASLDSGGKVPTSQLPALGSATLAGDSDVVIATPANNDVLTYETSSGKWKNKAAAGGSSAVRTTASVTTASLAAGATEQGTISMAKEGTLLVIQVSGSARVRLYSTAAARNADVSRSIGTTASSGSGLLVETVQNSASLFTLPLGPVAGILNLDSPITSTIYYSVTNLGSSSAAITVTFTYIPVEQ